MASPLVHLEDPTADPLVKAQLATLDKTAKKPSRAKRALTLAEVRALLARGFHCRTPASRHKRLFFLFQLLGALRRKAASHLQCVYRVADDGRVQLHPESPVRVEVDASSGRRY